MTRIIDAIVEVLERIGRLFGIGRRRDRDDPFAEPNRGFWRRLLGVLPGLILVLLIVWICVLVYRFDIYRGMEMSYPQQVLAVQTAELRPAPEAGGASEEDAPRTCAPSRVVQMQIALIDMMVNENDWVPGAPMYNLGFFGLVDFADTPWFDNKASFQTGMLRMVRRVSLDLADTLGRVRGTSQADPDLQAAQSRLRTNERAWVLNNPFDPQLQTVMQAASSSYRGAIPLYQRYNQRLEACEALFDVRRDNLRVLLDRIAADLGSTASQLSARSKATEWSPERKAFVDASGNNRGWFDFRADNLFHEARGQLFALHGLLQAVRVDFEAVSEGSDLDAVWDRMESHIADGARLNPWIVSNGAEEGVITPDHLSVMGEKVLRARANMVELREILDR